MDELTGRRAIAVFCGARKGNNPAFAALAAEVGRAIAERGWLLVYGGSSVGLMGEMAERKIDFRSALAGIEIEPKKPRGGAAKGRFGGSRQADMFTGGAKAGP